VLGIFFDSEKLTWSLAQEKSTRVLLRIKGPLLGDSLSLLETQKLLGSLTDVSQVCTFLRGFRHTLQLFLTDFENDECIHRSLPDQAKEDLWVWATTIADAMKGLPIPCRPCNFFTLPTYLSPIQQGDRFIPYLTDPHTCSYAAAKFLPLSGFADTIKAVSSMAGSLKVFLEGSGVLNR
jgi:hypothetical protein